MGRRVRTGTSGAAGVSAATGVAIAAGSAAAAAASGAGGAAAVTGAATGDPRAPTSRQRGVGQAPHSSTPSMDAALGREWPEAHAAAAGGGAPGLIAGGSGDPQGAEASGGPPRRLRLPAPPAGASPPTAVSFPPQPPQYAAAAGRAPQTHVAAPAVKAAALGGLIPTVIGPLAPGGPMPLAPGLLAPHGRLGTAPPRMLSPPSHPKAGAAADPKKLGDAGTAGKGSPSAAADPPSVEVFVAALRDNLDDIELSLLDLPHALATAQATLDAFGLAAGLAPPPGEPTLPLVGPAGHGAPGAGAAPPGDAPAQTAALQQAVRAAAENAKPRVPGAPPLALAEFKAPLASADEVDARIRDLSGQAGPAIPAQTLVERSGGRWQRPGAQSWSAERGGDGRLHVLRARVPARPSLNKVTTASAQWTASTEGACVKTVKDNLLDFASEWARAFGGISQVAPVSGAAGIALPQPAPIVAWLRRAGAAAAPDASSRR
ncbi:unnamed protein product [Prorocentrum cordatum]|uniref:Uncharacterized protein n=1 Tax=Prorocentrum cordatum TaxID=2364126 RepID=A0ABN9XQ29_9DINO|nr:unnamed protein product [Polarella glacialis]